MAGKRKRGPPLGSGEKGSILSVRVSPKTKWQLETAARRSQRKLSREVEGRLEFTFGRYGTGRPDHIADLAELVALLAQSVERRMRGQWDRHRATRECLVRAFTIMVDVYSKATVTPTSVSIPGSKANFERGRDDPATKAVDDVIFFLLHAQAYLPEHYGLGVGVLSKIQRRFEKRRRKK